jgi:hypothetical protein
MGALALDEYYIFPQKTLSIRAAVVSYGSHEFCGQMWQFVIEKPVTPNYFAKGNNLETQV